MSEQPAPAIGQIWREVDPRQERHIRVMAVGRAHVRLRAVIRHEGGWGPAPRSREGEAMLHRFNGKRGGYEFIENAP